MESNIRDTVVKGMIWKTLERIGVQGVQFLIQIVLARLLLPSEFGTVAIINVFILVANAIVQYGFSTALIQKNNSDSIDFSSVFFANFLLSFILYVFLFAIAPLISSFYNDDSLTILLRVQSLILFFGSISSIQNAILTKKMDFNSSFKINIISIILQGVSGILLASLNFGVWSLVFSQVVNSISLVIAGFYFLSWRPKWEFSFKRLKSLLSFGINILLATIIETVFTNIYSLVIGKIYSKDLLGYYNRGQSIPNMLVTTINGSIQGVIFPVLSKYQENRQQIKSLMKRSIKLSGYLVFPAIAGLVATAKHLIPFLLTDKWNGAIPFLQLSCLSLIFYPIHTTNLQAISAVGESKTYLKIEVAKKIVLVIALLLTFKISIYAMMVGSIIASMICTIINAWPNKRLFDYTILEQFLDLLPSVLLSMIMAISVYIIGELLSAGIFLKLVIQILAGIFIYLTLSIFFKIDSFYYIFDMIKQRILKFR